MSRITRLGPKDIQGYSFTDVTYTRAREKMEKEGTYKGENNGPGENGGNEGMLVTQVRT